MMIITIKYDQSTYFEKITISHPLGSKNSLMIFFVFDNNS